jgi:hypothetical protein
MRKIITALLSISIFLSGTALAETASTKPTVTKIKKCTFPKSRKRAPTWVCTGQDDKLEISAVGSFAKSKAGIAHMEQMATADARKKLAEKMNSEILENTKILKSVYAPNGTLFVLVGMDEPKMKNLPATGSE